MREYHVRFCERLAGEIPACLLSVLRAENFTTSGLYERRILRPAGFTSGEFYDQRVLQAENYTTSGF